MGATATGSFLGLGRLHVGSANLAVVLAVYPYYHCSAVNIGTATAPSSLILFANLKGVPISGRQFCTFISALSANVHFCKLHLHLHYPLQMSLPLLMLIKSMFYRRRLLADSVRGKYFA